MDEGCGFRSGIDLWHIRKKSVLRALMPYDALLHQK